MSSSDSSTESDIEENLRNLKLEDKDINILLLGETGVGKSTLINALANYFSQKYFDNAEKDGLVVLIPSIFKTTDKKGKDHEIKVGPAKDKNELLETGASATQDVKTYVFPVWRRRANVRLIDTPGMGDTRGIEQDEKNCDNILRYLKTLKKIHGICFLFKPTEARKTVFFEYCLSQMLCRLDKTACKNIFFLFTNTRGSDYGPGDTFSNLKSFMVDLQKKTPGVEIDVDKNKFCFDNEAFKFLAAVEKKVKFDGSMREVNLKSWQQSAGQCWRLVRHLQRDTPSYSTENLLLVNTARRILFRLSKVLADITELVDANQLIIDRLQINRNLEKQDIENLKKSHVTDVVNVERIQVNRTVLVCTSRTCADVYRVNGMHKWHYRNVCHDHCYETSNLVKDLIGCPTLVNCDVINKTTRSCTQCGCDFSVHMHIDYITRLVQNAVLDEDTHSRIATRESLLDSSKEIITDIIMKNKELSMEHDIVQKLQSKIALFLLKNAIIAKSDSYKEYIVYLMNQNQTVASATKANEDLKKRLQEYEETEKAFQRALKMYSTSSDLPFDGKDLAKKDLEKLFTLAHSGTKIKEIYDEQHKLENEACPTVKEYVHEKCYEKEDDQKNKPGRRGDHDGKRDGRRNDNFSQKQKERRGSEKQRDLDSRNRNSEPRRDFNRDRIDQEKGNADRNPDPRYQQYPRPRPLLHPQGAHGGHSDPPRFPMNYDRDRVDRPEQNRRSERREQDPRNEPPPSYHEVAHGGYRDPQHYGTDYERGPNYPHKAAGNYDKYDLDVKVTVTNPNPRSPQEAFYPPGDPYRHPPQHAPYPPQQAHYPPPQGYYPPPPGHYPPPPPHGPYPPEHRPYPDPYGAYPHHYPYPAPPKGAYNQGHHPPGPQNPSRPANWRGGGRGGRKNDDQSRADNRRDNQEGRRNADRRGRGGQREGRGRDGKPSFKPRNRKPQNQNKKDDSDSDSYESVASSIH